MPRLIKKLSSTTSRLGQILQHSTRQPRTATSPPPPPNMDEAVRRFLAAGTEPPVAHHTWTPNTPFDQPYHIYSALTKRWQGISPPSNPPAQASQPDLSTAFKSFTVYSWNIDFMLPLGKERLVAALTHLKALIDRDADANGPNIVFLQEMTNAGLRVIQAQEWVREGYYVTDVSNAYWASDAYGTCTLIPRTMRVRRVFRVHYAETIMERDGLFVDVDVDAGVDGATRCLRFCNTHLESLAFVPARRPAQMAVAAQVMKEEEVLGSVLGGDLNAIQPFDMTLPVGNGLVDAYLAVGGEEGREDGFTWGQMARTDQRQRFGLSRMDKLLFCGRVKVDKFGTFGYDVVLEEPSHRDELIQQGLQKPWVTDHLGVKGTFSID